MSEKINRAQTSDPGVRAVALVDLIKPSDAIDQIRLLKLRAEILRMQNYITTLKDQKEGPAPADAVNWHLWGLTPMECRLMSALERGGDLGKTYNQLFYALYGDQINDYPGEKIICVRVHHIRRRLLNMKAPYWVETIHGHGLKLHTGAPQYRLGPRGNTSWTVKSAPKTRPADL